MKLTMLGTGNALVTECYNTCFMLDDNGQLFLTDGGGGNNILHQIKYAGYDWKNVHHIFVTHKHIDHILGIVWMVRMICQFMKSGVYEGDAYIYSHGEILDLFLVEVHDGETLEIIGHKVTFFDIQSTKAKQFGYRMDLGDGKKLTCCGDEPLAHTREKYAKDSEWMLHEAFCLSSQADIFKPYEKTVKDACELAERLGVKNLLLYHTEDRNLEYRKELYGEEGREYYHGALWIPDDLEVIEIC